MKKISCKEFRGNMAIFLDLVHMYNESIIITRNGKDYVKIVNLKDGKDDNTLDCDE